MFECSKQPCGAHRTDRDRARIAYIRISKAMGLKHDNLLCFARKHRISLDWLICGDLKGLLRTVRARRSVA
jgi:hypothetical protein